MQSPGARRVLSSDLTSFPSLQPVIVVQKFKDEKDLIAKVRSPQGACDNGTFV